MPLRFWAGVWLSTAMLSAAVAWPRAGLAKLPAPAPAAHGAFIGKVVLVLLQDKGHPATRAGRSLWAVQRPVAYRTPAGDVITLPAGMVTDLASIPSAVSWLLPPDGPWAQIAVFHDLLYETRGTGVWHGRSGLSRGRPYTRAEADAVLRDGMADLGVAGWRRWAIYEGVRIGGGPGWGH